MSNEITSYGAGIRVSKTQAYVDHNTSIDVKKIELDETYLRNTIDRQVMALLSGTVADGKMFTDFGEKLIRKMKEQLSLDIGVMGAKGRLGFNEEQLELLQAAIEGRANEALVALQAEAVRGEDAAAPPPGAVTDDLADPMRGPAGP